MLTAEERRLATLEESAPPHIWIPDRRRQSSEAYMREYDDFHLSVVRNDKTGVYTADVFVGRDRKNRVLPWLGEFETRFAACNAAVRRAEEQKYPRVRYPDRPRMGRILTQNQRAVDETEPAYVIGQSALGLSAVNPRENWIPELCDGAPGIYYKAIEGIRAAVRGGGNQWQLVGKSSTIASFQSASKATPNDNILKEIGGTSTDGFIAWSERVYQHAVQAVEQYRLITPETFLRMTSWGVPLKIGAKFGLATLAQTWKSGNVQMLSETVSRLIGSATVFSNRVQLMIALPMLGKAVYEAVQQNRLTDFVSGLATTGLATGITNAIFALASACAYTVMPSVGPLFVEAVRYLGLESIVQNVVEYILPTTLRAVATAAVKTAQYVQQTTTTFWGWLKDAWNWLKGIF